MPLRIKTIIEKIDLNFYFIYAVGIIGFAITHLRPFMKMLTPLALFITAGYAVARTYSDDKTRKKRLLIPWCVGVIAVTIFLEILGVRFGLFFGEYDYGKVLGPQIMGVPFIIGVNWLIVIMGGMSLAKNYSGNIFIISLIAGTAAFLFDFLLEPAAISLGFWEWTGSIPLKNYISWFVITFISTAVFELLKINISGKWVINLLGAQTVFFLFIRIFIMFNVL